MAKITLKGIITDVGTPERVGDKGTVIQNIILLKKGWVDEYGEKKSPDEEWQLQIFNMKIEEFGIGQDYVGKKVEVDFYSSSRRIKGQVGKNDWFSVSNRLGKVTVIGDASEALSANAPLPDAYYEDIAAKSPEDDDLPF